MKKLFDLEPELIEVIQRVKKENNYKSEVAALSYIIRQYEENCSKVISDRDAEKIADVFLGKFNDTYYKFMERLRWATQTSEINSIVIKDGVNTILSKNGVQHGVLCDIAMSPVLQESEDYYKQKIEHFRQKKIDRENRGRE